MHGVPAKPQTLRAGSVLLVLLVTSVDPTLRAWFHPAGGPDVLEDHHPPCSCPRVTSGPGQRLTGVATCRKMRQGFWSQLRRNYAVRWKERSRDQRPA